MQIAMETDSSELERAFEEGVLIFAKQLPLLVSFLSVAVIVGNVVGKVRIFISDVSTFMVLLFQHIVYRVLVVVVFHSSRIWRKKCRVLVSKRLPTQRRLV